MQVKNRSPGKWMGPNFVQDDEILKDMDDKSVGKPSGACGFTEIGSVGSIGIHRIHGYSAC